MPKRPSPPQLRGVHGAERGVASTSPLSPPDAAWTAAQQPAGGRMREGCWATTSPTASAGSSAAAGMRAAAKAWATAPASV